MIAAPTLILFSLAYLGLLFGIAWFADRRADAGRSLIANPTVYALSLGVYCTSWTFYGSVGRAVASGVGFLPIYLGPTLLFALGGLLLHKMLRIAKANRITSIADFVASRYGKSQLLGGLVTLIAVFGVVPYIALQLKAVAGSFTQLSGVSAGGAVEPALVVACVLAAFTVLFGTRHLDATERHEGMVAAIAFESLVKLIAFLAVGGFVVYGLYGGFGALFARARAEPGLLNSALLGRPLDYGNWSALVVLAFFAVILLPRQFQITVVENVNPAHLRRATWAFPLYLFLINLFVLPIALAGVLSFGSGADPDGFVLSLPMAAEKPQLALAAFLGGLSAATGMVIVETIALSTMVCNDLVMPLLLRWRGLELTRRGDSARLLLSIRRFAIVGIVGLGYLYYRLAGEAYALVSIGLISFAAIAQLAPVVFGGMFWRGGTRAGALAALCAGFALWCYTLMLPSFAKSGWVGNEFLLHGPWGIEWLRPQQLFGIGGMTEITHCLVWSMLANLAAYIGVSLWRTPDAGEARQAALFVGETGGSLPGWRVGARYEHLRPLVERFLGGERAAEAFAAYARARGLAGAGELGSLRADPQLTQFSENLLAGAIGSASARAMVASLVDEAPLGIDEVLNILDEASQVRAYSRELERKSAELTRATAELSAANARLKELDRLKDDFMSTVTHELRTPLTSIRAFSEMLHDDPRIELHERKRFLGIIVSETERLSRLINQILDLAKLESGRADWRPLPLDLAAVVGESIDAISALAAARGVELVREFSDAALPVLADRDKLMQVVINLLSNALKFAPAGRGVVKVGAGRTGRDIEVRVADNGPGIRAEDRELIFDRFRQGGNVMTDKPQGTGLGLPIARQIIEHFGGRLWVESEPGQGACFRFRLPAREATATDNPAPEGTQ